MPSLLLALSLLACPALPAAETAPPPSPAPSALAGQYTGTWRQNDEVNGTLRLNLAPVDAFSWTVEASFTYEGGEVPTKLKSIRVDGSKIEFAFSWEIQGTPGLSKLSGEWTNDRLEGKYSSESGGNITAGTWKVTKT